MRALFVVAGGLMAITPGEAFSNPLWVKISEGDNGAVYEADINSIRELPPVEIVRPFPVKRIWIRANFSRVKSKASRSGMSLEAFNCADQTSATISRIEYSVNGSVLKRYVDTTDSEFDYEPVVPGSVGESMMMAACR